MSTYKPTSYWVKKMGMLPHPERGYYLETYRSAETLKRQSLPSRFSGDRAFSTAICFLLEGPHFSAFHRIESDELWHFYEGLPLQVYMIDPQGELNIIRLGRDPEQGEVFQAVVPAGYWFASQPVHAEGYSLVGCTVAPGFDFTGFELASRLEEFFPQHRDLILRLSR
jgi:predicted cupin superfamily sugar epimerase